MREEAAVVPRVRVETIITAIRYLLLVRARPISRHVHHQRRRATIIEEILHHARAAAVVGRSEPTTEEWQEVDLGPVIRSRSEDARHLDTDIDSRVIANHSRVDDEDEEGELGGAIVLLEKGCGVVITDRSVSWTLTKCSAQEGEERERSEMHCEKLWSRASMQRSRSVGGSQSDVDTGPDMSDEGQSCSRKRRDPNSPRQLL
jgi:hypothetical protein